MPLARHNSLLEDHRLYFFLYSFRESWKNGESAYSIFLNMLPLTPQTGHFSGASFSTVMPQTGQT